MLNKYLFSNGLPVVFLLLGLVFSCNRPAELLIVGGGKGNDVVTLCESNGISYKYFGTIDEAVHLAKEGQGVMLLSSSNDSEAVLGNMVGEIEEKGLRVFVEHRKDIPGLRFKDSTLTINKERAVVNTEKIEGLDSLDVLSVNSKDILLLEYPAKKKANTLLVMGKVAGYDNAEYGLQDTKTYPLLFVHNTNFLVSTMRLSNAIEGRFGPSEQWRDLFGYILGWVIGENLDLKNWEASLRPTYGKHVDLEEGALKNSVKNGVDWYFASKLLVDPSWEALYEMNTAKNGREVVHPAVTDDMPVGNGLNGIMEGHASRINPDGSQPLRWWIRGDCQAETAYALSSAALFLKDDLYQQTAKNLLQYLFEDSNLRQGERNDPKSPSFGLIGWATTDPDAYYGDDNARALLALLGASTNLMIDDWDAELIEGILGNFRTAGTNGFRGPWFRDKQMQQTTWQALGQRDIVNIHPHYESWLWALYLWLYDKTDYEPFLEKAKKAITITMEAFPDWKWTNGIQQEYARMILPLAWLVRVEDSRQHRDWLNKVVLKLLDDMDESGGIPEKLGKPGFGRYEKIASNAEYGTKEAPLISSESNRVSDLLYTMNFAFFSLNEAAKATGNKDYMAAVDSIANYMIRIQVTSPRHEELDGAWFRAFDYEKWEYWASNADSDWGPWGTLTGWTQGWIINGLINKAEKQSLWDLSKKKYDNKEFQALVSTKIESMLTP